MPQQKFSTWTPRSSVIPTSINEALDLVREHRAFKDIERLEFGDYGLEAALHEVLRAIKDGDRIALYADYDVDGTMSAVSWIWFLRAIGYSNFLHYIPCRFKEGYGVNLEAIKHLIHNEHADLIITMDTGITANEEAAYAKAHGVRFLCTDHHKIQTDKMPDCIVLNPKLHPDPLYQELCGCGITFVLLRKLAQHFDVPAQLWTDLVALAGMATICDVVPLNPVNHKLARLGVAALSKSRRSVLTSLRAACALEKGVDEKDVGFRLGPRINAVGRLDHADAVVNAFVGENPDDLIEFMESLNTKRRQLQDQIIREAMTAAKEFEDDPILFIGGDWHAGVVGIAASRIAETFWKPTWLFQIDQEKGVAKGSARSILGFDVTEAMQHVASLFTKFGGHRAAGGFTFPLTALEEIRAGLNAYAITQRNQNPDLWRSRAGFDFVLPVELAEIELARGLGDLRPYGNDFAEPRFVIKGRLRAVHHLNDKHTGEPKHSRVELISHNSKRSVKVIFFSEVIPQTIVDQDIEVLVTLEEKSFLGRPQLNVLGLDWKLYPKS